MLNPAVVQPQAARLCLPSTVAPRHHTPFRSDALNSLLHPDPLWLHCGNKLSCSASPGRWCTKCTLGTCWLTSASSFVDPNLRPQVMREMHAADLLFDQYLLDRVVHMVTALNTSAVRDFRRVGTLTAVQLITSWIHVTQALAEARDTAQRQVGDGASS